MTGYIVEIAPVAESDIREAFLWYGERNQLTADTFRAEVFDVIERITRTPLGKAADTEGNRRRILRRFPYTIVYEVLDSTITIIAVAHQRRRPHYWKV